MLPKIQAILRFMENGGKKALIQPGDIGRAPWRDGHLIVRMTQIGAPAYPAAPLNFNRVVIRRIDIFSPYDANGSSKMCVWQFNLSRQNRFQP